MPTRTFTDRRGEGWTVWNVRPDEHAVYTSPRVHLPPEMAEGWLCFESTGEKRRLCPVPAGWEELPDRGLDELLARSRRVPGRGERIGSP